MKKLLLILVLSMMTLGIAACGDADSGASGKIEAMSTLVDDYLNDKVDQKEYEEKGKEIGDSLKKDYPEISSYFDKYQAEKDEEKKKKIMAEMKEKYPKTAAALEQFVAKTIANFDKIMKKAMKEAGQKG